MKVLAVLNMSAYLKDLVKVKLDDENEKTLKEFNVADVKVLKKGKNNEPSEEEIGE